MSILGVYGFCAVTIPDCIFGCLYGKLGGVVVDIQEGDGMSKVNAKKLTERPCLTCGRYTSNKVVCCDKCLERGRKIAEMAK